MYSCYAKPESSSAGSHSLLQMIPAVANWISKNQNCQQLGRVQTCLSVTLWITFKETQNHFQWGALSLGIHLICYN